jgi:PAS domain S-box-containing protein
VAYAAAGGTSAPLAAAAFFDRLQQLFPATSRPLNFLRGIGIRPFLYRQRKTLLDAQNPVLPSAVEILESMDEAFYAIDRDWRFIYVNPGAEDFWGRPREDLLGSSMLEVFPAFAGSEPHAAHVRAMESGERSRFETISTVTKTPVELHFRPATWGLAVFFRDITERRQTERALRERSELISLAEQTAEIGVWDIDLEAGTVRGTPQFFRIMGLETTDQPVPIETTRKLRHPGDRERIIDGFHAAVREGRDSYEAEYRIVRPSDGQARWIFGRGRVIRDRDGHVIRYAGVDMDITERKQAEETALRLASIVESSDDAILGTDLDGIIESWNDSATRLYGYTSDEILGKPVTVLIPKDRRDEEPGIIERIRKGERVDHYETVRRRKDGGLIEISLTVSPIRDAAGRVVGASKIARDIAERRRAEEQERLLLREMNHRIKNLFSLASGVVTLSARAAKTPPELAEMIRERLSALSRAHALTLPEITGTGARIERSTTLAALVRTVLLPYVGDPLGDAKAMRISGPEILVGAKAASNLALLLYEFATNAAKYGALSAAEGWVDVDWSVEDGRLKLRWRERGGPALAHEPDFKGFGSRLSEGILAGAFRGEISRDWARAGLTIHLSMPADTLSQ